MATNKRFRREMSKNWVKFSFVTDPVTAQWIRNRSKKYGSITNTLEQLIRTVKIREEIQEANNSVSA
jgi:hypothetical protein